MSPMVAAVDRDVDRHVADDAHAPPGRVAAKREPLALEPHLLLDGVPAGVRRPVVAPRPCRARNARSSLGSTRASGSASSPPHDANADADAYGEPNSSGGLRGRTCHQRAPAAASQSTKANASAPSRPPGSEVGCS